MANYQAPNLADILRTLSALAPQGQQSEGLPQTPYHEPAAPPHPQQWPPAHQHPEPARPLIPTQQWDTTAQYESTQHQYIPVAQSKPSAQQLPPQPPKPQDPATITDWSTGLRCIMKSVSTNERLVGEIRKLIQTQHEHETQWYAGRQALLMKIEARKIGQKRLDDVLRAVGGQVPETDTTTQLPDTAEELRTFDMKVYRAQHQMVKEMSTKLKTLGIPFFGTRSELVDREPGAEGTGGGGRISERELVELQRRVLGIIEDLCW